MGPRASPFPPRTVDPPLSSNASCRLYTAPEPERVDLSVPVRRQFTEVQRRVGAARLPLRNHVVQLARFPFTRPPVVVDRSRAAPHSAQIRFRELAGALRELMAVLPVTRLDNIPIGRCSVRQWFVDC